MMYKGYHIKESKSPVTATYWDIDYKSKTLTCRAAVEYKVNNKLFSILDDAKLYVDTLTKQTFKQKLNIALK